MSLWLKIDAVLCISLGFLLKLTGHTLLLLIGAAGLVFTIVGVFEHGDGLFDISGLEVVGLLLFAGLMYRHYRYCKLFRSSFRTSILRPLYAFGWYTLITGIPIICYWIIQSELNRPFRLFETSEIKLLDWMFTLVVLYISAPCKLTSVSDTRAEAKEADQRFQLKPDTKAEQKANTETVVEPATERVALQQGTFLTGQQSSECSLELKPDDVVGSGKKETVK